jgi:hypothetical protein
VIRAVLAVVLTVALFAAALPAVDEGRAARTAMHLDGVVDRLERAALSLRAHEDPVSGRAPARRVVRFRLPASSWTAAGATLRVDGDADAITYRLAGGRPRRQSIRGIDLRTPNGSLVLRDAGRHRLDLTLVRDGGVGVVVRRG